MRDQDWSRAIGWALAGVAAHIEPRRAVRGLTPEQAATQPAGGLRPAHRLLHHIVFWQDIMLGVAEAATAAAGTAVPSEVEPVPWPSEPEDWDAEMAGWAELVGRFEANLQRAGRLAEEADLHAPIPAWGAEMTVGAALTAQATHNSYHLGQLVDARRATGAWPPPKG
jgi:uncharacterized damage-inducible protein DinB